MIFFIVIVFIKVNKNFVLKLLFNLFVFFMVVWYVILDCKGIIILNDMVYIDLMIFDF